MGGELFAESVPGKGSCFTVEFKAGEPPAEEELQNDLARIPSWAGGGNGGHFTILYVEDNPDNLVLIQQALRIRPQVRIISAKEGKKGIELALAHRPDLILMDINLLDMDGFAVMKALKVYKETQSIPVIAVSANATDRDIDSGLEAGFDSYITKPINIVHFMNIIDRLLSQKSKAETLKLSN